MSKVLDLHKLQRFESSGFIIESIPYMSRVAGFAEGLDLHSLGLIGDEATFRKSVVAAQDAFNEAYLHHEIFLALHDPLVEVAKTSDLLISGIAFLRVVRPKAVSTQFEYLDFHRESFYASGDFVRHQINIHVPLLNYTPPSSVKYIPFSHKIPSDAFSLHQISESETGFVRGSSEHRSGLMYRPKQIIAGCDLGKAIPFPVVVGEAAIFDSELIHGGGVNNTSEIRVSVDFSVIPVACVPDALNYQLAAESLSVGSGKKYVPIQTNTSSSNL